MSVKFQTYKGTRSILDTLVPRDTGGKKLPVKSVCRGYIVIAVYLDKWRGAGMPTRECRKPSLKTRENVTQLKCYQSSKAIPQAILVRVVAVYTSV